MSGLWFVAPGRSTHKAALTSVDDVDDGLRGLLQAGYDQNWP